MNEPSNGNGFVEKLKKLQELAQSTISAYDEIEAEIQQLKAQASEASSSIIADAGLAGFDRELLREFINSKRKYAIIPHGEKEWFVAVPKFMHYQLGWLFQEQEQYNVFLVNRYVDRLYPLPQDLREELGIHKPAVEALVKDGKLFVPQELTDSMFVQYRPYLVRREESGIIKIKPYKEFEMTAALIRDQIWPFAYQPVASEDLRAPSGGVVLRDYQLAAWETFLRSGAIGNFWPPGAGKMYFGLHALESVRGPKLVIAGDTTTIKEEWEKKIASLAPVARNETIVTTYQGAEKHLDKQFILVIFDEVHHLPAGTYGRLGTRLKTKYRIGLSATPFREDGRVDLIFALTGFPVGVDWSTLFSKGVIHKPTAHVHVVKNLTAKFSLLKELVDQTSPRRLVFCDSLDLGEQIAAQLSAPFVSGESRNRLATIHAYETVVISRVGDQGIDITDLKAVIEVDFLHGSRRQELQRFGRLLHSRFVGQYHLIMTEDEYVDHKKRLLSLYERGFQVVIEGAFQEVGRY